MVREALSQPAIWAVLSLLLIAVVALYFNKKRQRYDRLLAYANHDQNRLQAGLENKMRHLMQQGGLVVSKLRGRYPDAAAPLLQAVEVLPFLYDDFRRGLSARKSGHFKTLTHGVARARIHSPLGGEESLLFSRWTMELYAWLNVAQAYARHLAPL